MVKNSKTKVSKSEKAARDAIKKRRSTTNVANRNKGHQSSWLLDYRLTLFVVLVAILYYYYNYNQKSQNDNDPTSSSSPLSSRSATSNGDDAIYDPKIKNFVPVTPLREPGDLNKFFIRMITDEEVKEKYKPIIHSYPKNDVKIPTVGGSEEEDDNSNIIDGPWIISLQDFLTKEECNRVIDLVTLTPKIGWERSENNTGVTDTRTSQNAWCMEQCHLDNVIRTIHEKIMNLTHINEENYEHLQILKYEKGEFYNTHHDYNPKEIHEPSGVRILTIFLYLNNVEKGGGTMFPNLSNSNSQQQQQSLSNSNSLTIIPKIGNALIWPSVLNENPNELDPRVFHAALPVESGIKYGANTWIHQNKKKSYNVKDVWKYKIKL